MYWRKDPKIGGTFSGPPDWPRNGAVLKGVEHEVQGARWLPALARGELTLALAWQEREHEQSLRPASLRATPRSSRGSYVTLPCACRTTSACTGRRGGGTRALGRVRALRRHGRMDEAQDLLDSEPFQAGLRTEPWISLLVKRMLDH